LTEPKLVAFISEIENFDALTEGFTPADLTLALKTLQRRFDCGNNTFENIF